MDCVEEYNELKEKKRYQNVKLEDLEYMMECYDAAVENLNKDEKNFYDGIWETITDLQKECEDIIVEIEERLEEVGSLCDQERKAEEHYLEMEYRRDSVRGL